MFYFIKLSFEIYLQNHSRHEVFADSPERTGYTILDAPTQQTSVVPPVTLNYEFLEDRSCDSIFKSTVLVNVQQMNEQMHLLHHIAIYLPALYVMNP